MELSWTPSALHDLTSAGNYIAEDNPKAARDMARRVREAVEYLMEYPVWGAQGGCEAHGNSSYPARPSSSFIGFGSTVFRYCEFFTTLESGHNT